MRILGIDAALRCTGYGVIESDGHRFEAVDCGVIRTPRSAPTTECLRRAMLGVRDLIRSYHPEAASIEGGFYFRNVKTAMTLGAVRGAVMAVLAEHGIPVYEYAPRRVKQAVCGYGNAAKEQVALMVGTLLHLDVSEIDDDATDALALALCHAQTAFTAEGLYLPDPL